MRSILLILAVLPVLGVHLATRPAPAQEPRDAVPFLEERGIVRVITVEADGSFSPWLYTPDFWLSQLAVLAEAGMNRLDLRGIYRLDTGARANLLPYFALAAGERYARPAAYYETVHNLMMLCEVVERAAEQDIRVGLINDGWDIEPDDLVDPLGLVMTRVDPGVDFDWVGDGPAEGVEVDDFAVRWTGFVVPRESGEYTFVTEADDGTRLWICGEPLIDDWGRMQGVHEMQGRATLVAGKRYPIRLDYLELKYAAVVRLLWETPSQNREVVPVECLVPATGEGQGLTGEYFTRRRYAREVSARLARQLADACPDLDRIGFDPQDSDKALEDAEAIWFPVLDAHPELDLVVPAGTRPAAAFDALALRYPGRVTVLADWNGDHLALPYPALADGDPARAFLHGGGERGWRLVWRLGAATHRVFPWIDPEFIRACARNARRFDGQGFAWEPIGCYGPQACERLYREPVAWNWLHERDAATYRAWGLFGSDPDANADPVAAAFAVVAGTAGVPLDALIAASAIVPTVAALHAVGMRLETWAPELEPGNDGRSIDAFIHVPPLDAQRDRSIARAVRDRVEGTPWNGRDPLAAMEALDAAVVEEAGTPLARDIGSLQALGAYYRNKTAAAAALETYYQTGCALELDAAEAAVREASAAWEWLVAITTQQYRPFVEASRTKTDAFTWERGRRELEADCKRLVELREELAGIEGLVVRHVPVWRARPGEPLALRCSVLGTDDARVALVYRIDDGELRRVGSRKGVWTIPALPATARTLKYRFEAAAGGRTATWPPQGLQTVSLADP